jgi:glutathione S-transferase
MPESDGPLTLEGLAQILRQHMDASAAQFAEERAERQAQDVQLRARMDELRGQVVIVADLAHAMSQNALRQAEELAEHRQEIRKIYARMEQQDARIEQQNIRIEQLHRDIRRILDTMQRPAGDGGGRPQE